MISGELPTSVTLRRPQEEHERAGVHDPQRAVDLERIDRESALAAAG